MRYEGKKLFTLIPGKIYVSDGEMWLKIPVQTSRHHIGIKKQISQKGSTGDKLTYHLLGSKGTT